jgi:flagellin
MFTEDFMSRINTNVQSMIAQRVLGQNNSGLGSTLERLSTGLRINRGKDDPAGLIASESLRSQIKSTTAALSNADRANQVVNTAEGGLQEVSGLLTELQGLVTNTASAAGLSSDEKKANQLQVDSILQTIDRISGATSFQGIKLLNGNYDFKVSGMAAGVSDFRVNAAKFTGANQALNALVTKSAQQGGLYMNFSGTAIDLSGVANGALRMEVRGSKGARELTFTSGTSLANVIKSINTFTDVTGVSASLSTNTSGIKLTSTEFGSNESVSVKVLQSSGMGGTGIFQLSGTNFGSAQAAAAGTWTSATAAGGIEDKGQDIEATINGIRAVSSGKTARINTDFLDVELTFTTATSQTLAAVGAGGNTGFITGGGANFALAGNVDIAGKVSIGVSDTAVRKLGSSVSGYLSSLGSGQSNSLDGSNDLSGAQKIISESINQISSLRGRLGAFQKNTVGATIRSLNVAVENSQAAESAIRDADFATETAALTRSQILVSASTNVLGLANQSPQSVLQLLG